MFETAELGQKVSKAEYDKVVPDLRLNLWRVQNELRLNSDFSVIVVFGGVDGAGKSEMLNVLHEWMDPRFLNVDVYDTPTQEEAERPAMWRFWRELPPKGRISLVLGAWHSQPIVSRVYGETSDDELDASLAHINTFEKMLVDDGTLILKYWFHLSKERQRHRLKKLAKDPLQSWRVAERDRRHFKLYDKFIKVSERALRETSTGDAPWTVVEATDRRYRELKVGRHLRDALDKRLAVPPAAPHKPRPARRQRGGQPTILTTLDLSKTLPYKQYRKHLEEEKAKLAALSREAKKEGVSTLVLFEGSDAAGKGGAIRRLTSALDARGYQVIPIAAPNDEERARHYLWRFWRHLPRAGRFTIFDRTWYGRVLVERVEGFTPEPVWRRAYKELNELEELLTGHGMAVVKFWLHIDKEEQLKRFKAREKTPYKKYKITEEDYRNRKRWDLYSEAVHELVERTSTAQAPWTLVEANDKRFARVKVLKTIRKTLERALKNKQRRGKKSK